MGRRLTTCFARAKNQSMLAVMEGSPEWQRTADGGAREDNASTPSPAVRQPRS